MAVKAGQTLYCVLELFTNVNNFPLFGPLVNLEDATSTLALLVYDQLNFFSANGNLVSGVAGSTIAYAYDATWPGNPANPFFAFGGIYAPPVVSDKALSMSYAPAVLANWSGTAPTSVANALDRIAAKIGPIL
jgi:hypothetical protein